MHALCEGMCACRGDERGDGGAAATKENENEYGGLTAMLRRLVEAAQSVKKGTVELLEYPGMWKYLAMALFLINLKQAYRCVASRVQCCTGTGVCRGVSPTVSCK